jgi:hypothetical protein
MNKNHKMKKEPKNKEEPRKKNESKIGVQASKNNVASSKSFNKK